MIQRLLHVWLTYLRVSHEALQGTLLTVNKFQGMPVLLMQKSDQILLWFLNIIKFKSLMGKQRFHKSSNIGIICKQLLNGDSISLLPK